MVTSKVTFTLDRDTVERTSDCAAQLAVPKSQVIRRAIQDFHERLGRVSEPERRRRLRLFDELLPAIPHRSRDAVDRELRAIRAARRAYGRRGSEKFRG